MASGSSEAPIDVDIDEPKDKAAEATADAVQPSINRFGAEMAPGPPNSVGVVGPMRPLEPVLTAKKALRTLRSSTDRLRRHGRIGLASKLLARRPHKH